ncbi:GNAT family N-acetyltransferase [Streptomyces sp. NPDC101191]|uniref:GNAT family N-acetyltransferase n=1 Tax=Streptomyces sp. NPDC101191 TaxID=3366126 RepID=UPI00381D9E01
MRDEVKLCDGVVTLSPLDPADAAPAAAEAAPVPVDAAPAIAEEDPAPTPGASRSRHRPRPRWRPHGTGRTFAIRADRLVGTVELRPPAAGTAHGDVDLSYALRPEARGRGFATRAVLLACAHAQAEGARRAVIVTAADAPAASAVAHRAGFVRRGQISHADGAVYDWYVKDLAGTC